jgi:hypothetical protein
MMRTKKWHIEWMNVLITCLDPNKLIPLIACKAATAIPMDDEFNSGMP